MRGTESYKIQYPSPPKMHLIFYWKDIDWWFFFTHIRDCHPFLTIMIAVCMSSEPVGHVVIQIWQHLMAEARNEWKGTSFPTALQIVSRLYFFIISGENPSLFLFS